MGAQKCLAACVTHVEVLGYEYELLCRRGLFARNLYKLPRTAGRRRRIRMHFAAGRMMAISVRYDGGVTLNWILGTGCCGDGFFARTGWFECEVSKWAGAFSEGCGAYFWCITGSARMAWCMEGSFVNWRVGGGVGVLSLGISNERYVKRISSKLLGSLIRKLYICECVKSQD